MKIRSLKYQRGFLGGGIEEGIRAFMIAIFIGGVVCGWVVWEGLPMLWDYLKPWLHTITA